MDYAADYAAGLSEEGQVKQVGNSFSYVLGCWVAPGMAYPVTRCERSRARHPFPHTGLTPNLSPIIRNTDYLTSAGQPDYRLEATSAFDGGEGAPPISVKPPYTSNYGWISRDFGYQVVNLDGTVGRGSRKKQDLDVTADELCCSDATQVYANVQIKLRTE